MITRPNIIKAMVKSAEKFDADMRRKAQAFDLMATLTEAERETLAEIAIRHGGDTWDLELYLEAYWQKPVTSENIVQFRRSFSEWMRREVGK